MRARTRGNAQRVLLAAAASIVLLAGLKAAGDVILPIVFSAFLSAAALPGVRYLQRRGLPSGVAIPVVVVVVAGLLVGVSGVLAGAVRSFTTEIGRYEPQLDAFAAQLVSTAEGYGLDLSSAEPTPTDGSVSGRTAWIDVNGDDRPDLLVSDKTGMPYALYRNNGDGTFTDWSERVAEFAPTVPDERGIVASRELDLSEVLTPAAIMQGVRQTLNAVVGLLGRTLIVVITMTFILLEASEIEQKFQLAFGAGPEVPGPFAEASEKIQRYLLIKTLVSLITGVAAGLCCRVIGIDFWLLWGLLAFLLNYIPSVGSILAALPPMLLALVQYGWPEATACVGAYVAINVTLGNLIEPRWMGSSLGLSPLVVFLSLIFWGWMWGPVGMLLCVPMTVITQLVLDSNDETRWIAVFLGSPRAIRRQAGETVQPPPSRATPSFASRSEG